MRAAVAAPRRPPVRLRHPPGRGAPGLAGRLVRRAPRWRLRPGRPPPVAAQPRAPVHDRDRPALLVAGARATRRAPCRRSAGSPTSSPRSSLSAFLGLALTFAPPLYGYYENLPERLWGISAAKDQNLGGILMTTEQALVLFAADRVAARAPVPRGGRGRARLQARAARAGSTRTEARPWPCPALRRGSCIRLRQPSPCRAPHLPSQSVAVVAVTHP